MHPCPICKTPVTKDAPAWPFCCDRCRLIDLGNWLGGKYRVPGEPASPGQESDDEKPSGAG